MKNVVINGREYCKDDIQHRDLTIKFLENENRLCNEYINKIIHQKDVDHLGVRNFDDALKLVAQNNIIITSYKETVKLYYEEIYKLI